MTYFTPYICLRELTKSDPLVLVVFGNANVIDSWLARLTMLTGCRSDECLHK